MQGFSDTDIAEKEIALRDHLSFPDLVKDIISLIKESKLTYGQAFAALDEAKFALQFCDVNTNPCE